MTEVLKPPMGLWLFTFTQEDRVLSTARIAAPDGAIACKIMGAVVKRPLMYQRNTHPEPGTILQHMGKMDLDAPHILSLVDKEGNQLLTEAEMARAVNEEGRLLPA